MKENDSVNYMRIAKAIHFIKTHFKAQPSLEEIAKEVCLSPFHFQRLFTEWAGTSPKKFLQYISIEHAKNILKGDQSPTLFEIAFETGLSGTSRLHDLFVSIEGMTPAEFKNEGKSLTIQYSFSDSPFGELIVASTERGLCHMAFIENQEQALAELKGNFPNAHFLNQLNQIQENALLIFKNTPEHIPQIKLHLKGTAFQLKVWESLLNIPRGKLVSYGNIAQQIEKPKASRAVGTAIGSNPIAFLIPCHRVIQSSGNLGGYKWGKTRKTAIIGWESAKSIR